MIRICAIALTAWVFVGGPLLCLSGLTAHECDAREACEQCGMEPCPKGHACHRDPCRIDLTTRPHSSYSDDLGAVVAKMAAPSPAVTATLCDFVSTAGLSAPPDARGLGPPLPAPNRILPLLV